MKTLLLNTARWKKSALASTTPPLTYAALRLSTCVTLARAPRRLAADPEAKRSPWALAYQLTF